ncbi:MAG: hypothetical protein QF473_37665, partial [Planctomycetota bacterium]|nr:hypothetical protein [Planctomycetota bacterium]
MPRIILIVHIASIALIVPSYGQSSSDYAKLRRTIDKLFRKKAVSEEKVSEQVDKIVDRYALIHNQLSKQKVSSERKAIAKEGVKLFVKLYFQRLQGKSDSGKAMAVLRLVLENRALISEIMLSDEPASMISRKLMLYMERNQSLGYETPVAVKQKFFKMSVTDNDLRIVPEKIMLVSDIGLAGHQNQGIDAGETISIKLTLKNHGDKPWRSTSGFLSADDDPYLTVDQSEVVDCEKSIETGETVTFGPGTEITPSGNFMLTVSPDCPDGHRARLKLLVWDTDRGKFEQRFALTVFNVGPLTFGKAKIDDDLPGKSDGDGDAAIEPEETIEYVLGVNNRGTPEVQNVSATLISSAEFIEFLPGEDRLRFRSIAGKSERALAASYV